MTKLERTVADVHKLPFCIFVGVVGVNHPNQMQFPADANKLFPSLVNLLPHSKAGQCRHTYNRPQYTTSRVFLPGSHHCAQQSYSIGRKSSLQTSIRLEQAISCLTGEQGTRTDSSTCTGCGWFLEKGTQTHPGQKPCKTSTSCSRKTLQSFLCPPRQDVPFPASP